MNRFAMRALRAALLLALASAILPAAASAGEYTVPFCTNHPTGARPGWVETVTDGGASGTPYFYRSLSCGVGQQGYYRRFEVNTVAAGASADWTFHAPPNTHVSRLQIAQSGTPRSQGAADAVYAELEGGGRTTLAVAVGNAGSTLSNATYTLPSTGPRAIRIQTSLACQPSANCAGVWNNAYGNEYYVRGGVVYLNDPSNPSIATPGGAGWQSSPPDGANPVDYDVSDTGSGVREVRLYVDGILVETRASNCTANAVVPCPLTATGSLTFDTTRLSEGEHTVAVVAVDASGNVTPQAERDLTVTVRRVPGSSTTSPPTAGGGTGTGGAPAAGTPIQGNPGTWTGADLTFAYQWMRCDQNGLNCVPISGANGLSYTPTSADLGHTLVFCVTASNSGGQTERCSAPTAVVVAPTTSTSGGGTATTNDMPPTGADGADGRDGTNGTGAVVQRANLTAVLSSRSTVQRVRYGRRVPITGRLLGPDGQPVAGARLSVQTQTAMPGAAMADAAQVATGADGRFRWVAPAGPSRLIRFAYRATAGEVTYVDTTDVKLLVKAGVTFKASPRKVRNKQTAVFTGRVLGKPIAKRGVLVDLQVFYRKKWRTFAAPRTNKRGAYRFKYRFTAGAATWKFRARVRPGADYPYEQGLSRQRRVKVTH